MYLLLITVFCAMFVRCKKGIRAVAVYIAYNKSTTALGPLSYLMVVNSYEEVHVHGVARQGEGNTVSERNEDVGIELSLNNYVGE